VKVHTLPNFAVKGQGVLPAGDWTAVGIAPGSIVDTCLIGGHRLGPMSLLPITQGGIAVQGLKARKATSSIGGENGFDKDEVEGVPFPLGGHLGSLELLLYEKCDQLVPPGPRAPFRVANRVVGTAFGVLALRLPFMGRAAAVIAATGTLGENIDFTIKIRGIIYHSLPLGESIGNADTIATVQDFIAEATDQTYFQGGATRRVSWVNTQNLATIVYVGGRGDLSEAFDEIEVSIISAGGATAMVQAEAYGERVL
jgi:hypothetical protein